MKAADGRKRAYTSALSLAFALLADPAQATDEEDALAAARTCEKEVREHGAAVLADCMDPVALADFKQLLLTVLDRFPQNQDAMMRRAVGESISREAVATLPPVELMRRVLRQRESVTNKAGIATNVDIIGAVKEGGRVHVLVRERSGPLKPAGQEVAATEVRTYIKRDGRWRSELTADANQFEELMKRQLR